MFGSHRPRAVAAGFWVLLVAAAAVSSIPGSAGATTAPPTPIFSDGFESGNLSQWTAARGIAAQQQVSYAGSWSARATATGAPAYAYESLSPTQPELYYDGRFDVVSQSTNASLVRFRTSSVGAILTILRRSDGRLAYYNEVTGVTTVGPTVSTGSWHELEVHVLVNGGSSLVEVWLDGNKLTTLSKTDSLGTTPVGRVYIGDPAGGRTFDSVFDNQFLWSGTAAPGNPQSSSPQSGPTVPAGLAVTGVTASSISLAWTSSTDAAGVTGYDLFLDGSRIGSTTSTNYTFTGLACGTSHNLGVDAFDAAGNLSVQATLIAATSPCSGPTAPSVPTGLSLSAVTQSSLSLSWNASTGSAGVAGYDLFQNGSKVGRVSGLSYTFNGLACGTSYTLGVDSFDTAGGVSGQVTITGSTRPCSGSVAFYVSPVGSDANPGTFDQPWQTLKKAMTTLTPGQTAYLRAGTYKEASSGSCGVQYNKLVWTTSGTSSAPITISGYPGEEKKVIVPTAIKLAGNYERLTNMVVDKNVGWSTFDNTCDGGPSLNVFGLNDTVSGVEVRNSAMSGIYLEGADGASIVGNWIHNNGTHWNLDHGIYWCSGANSVAADNIVQDNYANGIKVGPDAQAVLVTENTVDGNGRSGIIVSGDTTHVSNNNTIADNILTWNGAGSGGGYGLRTYWETAGVGTGNQAFSNLMYGNTAGNVWISGGGMTQSGSIFQDPLFVNRPAGDFHLQAGSPAVDAASSSYAVSRAFDGVLRPLGAGPDLGAYER